MRTFVIQWTAATVALLMARVIRRELRRPQPGVCTCPACRGCSCSSCDSDRLWHDVPVAA